jgi:RHS repeat-associated protein
LTYSYDLVARRTSVGGSLAAVNLPNAVTQTAYNANNQATMWGTANLFFDFNGNMTSNGTDGYTWDARNHLVSTLSSASFQYDAFGRRTSKTIGGTTASFLYDGANVVQEVIGGTNTANSLTGRIDEVFQRTDSAGARSFVTDALRNALALTDSTGAMQTQYTYGPFGNVTASGAATTNSFAFTGRGLDATGLYFYRARYYDPQLSRFISEDPIGFKGGINVYAYVGNNPISFVDPLGLDACGDPNGPQRQVQQAAHDYVLSWTDAAGGPNPHTGMPGIPAGPLGPPKDFSVPEVGGAAKSAWDFYKIKKSADKFSKALSDALNDLANAAGGCPSGAAM